MTEKAAPASCPLPSPSPPPPEVTTTPTTTTSPISGFFKRNSFFSNVSSNLSALTQTIQTKGIPEMNKRLSELQQIARELPSQLAGDLESERTSFIQQNKNMVDGGGSHKAAKGSELVAPWVGYKGYEKEMKKVIMNISKDERNFLIPPPEETSFQFDLNAYNQSAQAALQQDKQLSHMRFLLVPQQVKEPIFWKNYFYRVTLAKQTVLSHPPSEEEIKKQNEAILFDFKDDDDEEEEEEEEEEVESTSTTIVKKEEEATITATTALSSKEEKKNEEEEVENYEGMEEWEIELRKAAII